MKAGDKTDRYPWLASVGQQVLGIESASLEATVDDSEKLFFSHQIRIADKSWYLLVGLDSEVVFSDLSAAKRNAIVTAVIATVVSIIVALLILRVLYRPILVLKETVLILSQGNGDLTQRIEVKTDDDLGQISQGVNAFIDNLQSMMLEIRQVSDQLNENVDRMKDQS